MKVTKTRGWGWHTRLHELGGQTVYSKHNTWETSAKSRCVVAPYPAADTKCAGWLPQERRYTPKQWEISPPEQSHRQDRIAGHIFSNILCLYSIFPLWTSLQNVNQNHMAVKSQICEPQDTPQKPHHLYCIPLEYNKFSQHGLKLCWLQTEFQKDLAGGR